MHNRRRLIGSLSSVSAAIALGLSATVRNALAQEAE